MLNNAKIWQYVYGDSIPKCQINIFAKLAWDTIGNFLKIPAIISGYTVNCIDIM